MNTARIKHITPVISSRLHAEAALTELAQLTIARNQAQLSLDEALLAVRSEREGEITSLDQQIAAKAELLKGWASVNLEVFGKLKSLEMQGGVLGWRQSTKLKPLSKWTWDKVLANLRKLGKCCFVREKFEVNKDAIRTAAQDGALTEEGLKELGCRLVPEDTFFVEPRLEVVDSRVTLEAA